MPTPRRRELDGKGDEEVEQRRSGSDGAPLKSLESERRTAMIVEDANSSRSEPNRYRFRILVATGRL